MSTLEPGKIRRILLKGDPKRVAKLLNRLREAKELDRLFQAVLAIATDAVETPSQHNGSLIPNIQNKNKAINATASFDLTLPVLRALEEHFSTFSALSAHEWANQLLDLLDNSQQLRSIDSRLCLAALLLRSLVEQVPLLSATRLRQVVRERLPETIVHIWPKAQATDEPVLPSPSYNSQHPGAQLCLCLVQCVLMELAYLRGVSSAGAAASQAQLAEEATKVWARLLAGIQLSLEDCPLLLLSTLLLNAATGDPGTEESEEKSNENGAQKAEENGFDGWWRSNRRIVKRIRRGKLLQRCTAAEEEKAKEEEQKEDNKGMTKSETQKSGPALGNGRLDLGMEVDDGVAGNGEEPDERGKPVECSYNSALFDLLHRFIGPICGLCPGKLHFPILQFMVTFARRRNRLPNLLHSLAKNPSIRFGDVGQSVEQALARALPPAEYNNKKRCKHAEEANNHQIRWWKWAGESQPPRSRKRKRKAADDESAPPPPSDWAGLLAIFEEERPGISPEDQEQLLATALSHFSNAQLEQLLSSAPLLSAGQSSASSSTHHRLRLLCSLCTQRRTFSLPFRDADFAELMLAEPEPRTQSLLFGTRVVTMCSHQQQQQKRERLPQLADFCSLCLALFRPLDQFVDSIVGEEAKRRFLMAELSFLRCLLVSAPNNLLSGLAPLIVQLMPEFFVQASNYRIQEPAQAQQQGTAAFDWRAAADQFADRLEHSLSCLCREVVKRAKHFGNLLPFVMANSLTGQRELRLPHFLLMSALNEEHGMALLSANLPAVEKRKFALLQAQFYESNKIVG